MTEHGINGEVIVADNGSSDGSQELAADLGARVVSVPGKGYGNALMGGIAAAQGRYVIMGDADDSYDFTEVPRFLDRLRDGYDLVQGCRLPSGGGSIMPGAMPFLHRWWGNPMFSLLVRHWFNAPIHDVYCGLRGFSRELYERLGLQCTGMEFAVEMVIKSSLFQERIAEVPITLHPDGRKTRAPHLRTFRDGWRTLRFFLMFSPRWLFLVPGLILILLGTLGYALALPGVTFRGVTLDVHTLLFASLFLLMGYQSLHFSVLTKTFAITEGMLPPDPRLERFYQVATLERGLLLAAVAILGGGNPAGNLGPPVAVDRVRRSGLCKDDARGDSRSDAGRPWIPDRLVRVLSQHPGNSAAMTWIEWIHHRLVINRRARVLSCHLARLLPRDASVLDVGCGDGWVAALMAKERPDLRIRGVDVLVREGTQIPVERFDGERLPFEDRSMDAVTLIDVLHHAEQPGALLLEAARVARWGVVIKDHLLGGFLAGATLRFMDRVGNRRYHVALPHNYWTRIQWEREFAALGLVVDHWQAELGLYPWPASLAFDRSLHFIARVSLADS
jgi:SAM-dependent methyltransferase